MGIKAYCFGEVGDGILTTAQLGERLANVGVNVRLGWVGG